MWTGGALAVDPVADADVAKYLLSRDGVEVAQADPVAGGGAVVFTGRTCPGEGMFRFTARSKDMSGNVSAPGPAFVVTLDHTAPAIPGSPRLVSSFSWQEP